MDDSDEAVYDAGASRGIEVAIEGTWSTISDWGERGLGQIVKAGPNLRGSA
jgi:hypothetical protein